MPLPYLVFSDQKGKIFHHPYLRMSVKDFSGFSYPKENELIKLPKGSSLFYLPNRSPVGFDPNRKSFEVLSEFNKRKVFAVAAFPIPAYLRLHNPSYMLENKKTLPLWAYTACGFYRGDFYLAAKRIDKRVRQSPRFYNNNLIEKKAKEAIKEYPNNRLYRHLFNCALNYNCLAAKNLFLGRWEAPLPTARFCNAKCIGCLSQQDGECVSSHQRIKFRPDIDEISQVTLNHLKTAKEAIVSFGQGCEGEPLLCAKTIAKSIIKVRNMTKRGTINMNTNASLPKNIKMLCEAGIDSFRVSLNSTQKKHYNFYFRPKNYKFSDVIKSIEIAKRHKKFVSINLFAFPGFSDSKEEEKSLIKFIKNTGIDMVQWRNLNIDPEYMFSQKAFRNLKSKGLISLIDAVRGKFPSLKFGYFNLPKEKFK